MVSRAGGISKIMTNPYTLDSVFASFFVVGNLMRCWRIIESYSTHVHLYCLMDYAKFNRKFSIWNPREVAFVYLRCSWIFCCRPSAQKNALETMSAYSIIIIENMLGVTTSHLKTIQP